MPGRGRPKKESVNPEVVKTPKKRGRTSSTVKVSTKKSRSLSKAKPASKKAKKEKPSGKVTISDRRIINNVVHYKLKIGGGAPDWTAIYECPDVEAVLAWEKKNLVAGKGDGKDADKESGHHELEKIVDEKIRYKSVFYHVRWKGFTKKDDTWEKANKILEDSPEAVAKWEDVKTAKAVKSAEKRKKRDEREAERAAQRALEPKKKRGNPNLGKWKKEHGGQSKKLKRGNPNWGKTEAVGEE